MRPATWAMPLAAAALAGSAAAATPAAPLPPEFAALVAHVEQRVTLWHEGAPINSLVLDDRQTVLNPIAIGCARREPLVIIDIDPAPGGAAVTAESVGAWRQSVAAMRAAGAGILWVTEQSNVDRLIVALAPAGWMAADTIAGPLGPGDRKQLIRQRWAATHCVLAVVGDTRSDADEAYAYLRSADASLPIDRYWGQGWFLLPAPLATP
jgi:hypothetical protein